MSPNALCLLLFLLSAVRAQSGKPITLPVLGTTLGTGEYYIDFVLGGEALTMQLDTTSTDTFVYSSTIIGPKISRARGYDPTESETVEEVPCVKDCDRCINETCRFLIPLPGSTRLEGTVLTEEMNFKEISHLSWNGTFGLITKERGWHINTRQSGILGLSDPMWGKRILSKPTMLESFFQENDLYPSIGFCLHKDGERSIIQLGSNETANPHIKWVNCTAWNCPFEIETISIGPKKIPLPPEKINGISNGAIFHSGSIFLLLTPPAFGAVKDYFYSMCLTGSDIPALCDGSATLNLLTGYCFPMDYQTVSLFPTLEFSIKDVGPLVLTAFDYFLYEPRSRQYCLAIADSGIVNELVFGQVVLNNFYVIFDHKEHRMGIADSDHCPTF